MFTLLPSNFTGSGIFFGSSGSSCTHKYFCLRPSACVMCWQTWIVSSSMLEGSISAITLSRADKTLLNLVLFLQFALNSRQNSSVLTFELNSTIGKLLLHWPACKTIGRKWSSYISQATNIFHVECGRFVFITPIYSPCCGDLRGQWGRILFFRHFVSNFGIAIDRTISSIYIIKLWLNIRI